MTHRFTTTTTTTTRQLIQSFNHSQFSFLTVSGFPQLIHQWTWSKDEMGTWGQVGPGVGVGGERGAGVCPGVSSGRVSLLLVLLSGLTGAQPQGPLNLEVRSTKIKLGKERGSCHVRLFSRGAAGAEDGKRDENGGGGGRSRPPKHFLLQRCCRSWQLCTHEAA